VSTESYTLLDTAGRGRHLGRHQLPGERERIAFHVRQFEHGCYGDHCPESGRLYTAWQAVLGGAGDGRWA
jgi:hypothetical protein